MACRSIPPKQGSGSVPSAAAGYNASGELGDGTFTEKATPVAFSGLSSSLITIGAGVYHTCALAGAGAAECWGNDEYGQLGDGTRTNTTEPVPVIGLSRVTCTINTGTVKPSPGLSVAPAVQTMKIIGTLSGCSGEAFTQVEYTATLLSETPGVALEGEVASGSHAPLTFSGTVSQSYTGAATCSTKTVKKGTFTGSAVNFE